MLMGGSPLLLGNAVVSDRSLIPKVVVSWYECRYLNSGWRCRGSCRFYFSKLRGWFVFGWTDGRTGLCDWVSGM